jgi:glycosyltransferase involved in cell wall biosynthesis
MEKHLGAVVFVGDKCTLAYNKLFVMERVLREIATTYEFFDLTTSSRFWFLRKLKRLFRYWALYRQLGTAHIGGVIWVSEFAFAPLHLLFGKLIATLKGMSVVSGPHTLSVDQVLLTDPLYARGTLSLTQRLRLKYLNFRDAWTIRCVDVVQSYSKEYVDRILTTLRVEKTSVLFPIGAPDELTNVCSWEDLQPNQRSPLVLVFWGIANAFHGLDVLPAAIERVRDGGHRIHVAIHSPRNTFTEQLMDDVRARGLEDWFTYYAEKKFSFQDISNAHVAISNLVSGNLNSRTRAMVDTVTSNKMYEILALGMPMLLADTPAVRSIVDETSALLVTPGSAEQLGSVLQRIVAGEIDIRRVARNGQALFKKTLSNSAIARSVAMQFASWN